MSAGAPTWKRPKARLHATAAFEFLHRKAVEMDPQAADRVPASARLRPPAEKGTPMRLAVLATLVSLAMPAAARAAAPPPLKTDEERTLYALGEVAARSFKELNLSAKELEFVKRGLSDALTPGKKPEVDPAAYEKKVQEFAMKRMQASADAHKQAGTRYLEQAAKEKGAQKTATGLIYFPEKEGTGPSPKPEDTVKVNYTGKLTDGTVFDASAQHGGPAEFPVNRVIPCWSQGLQLMKVGGKARLVCPSDLAYGDRGAPPKIPGGSVLVFDVELLEIVPAASSTPATPAPPASK